MEAFVALALAPAIALMWLFYVGDRYEPEPRGLVLKIMALGALAAIPVVIVELAVTPWFGSSEGAKSTYDVAVFAFLGVALWEELFKWLVVMLFIFRHAEFDEPFDGIVYCVASSLGFAALENVLYVLGATANSPLAGLMVGFLRAFLSVPAHAMFGATMGYCLGHARFARSSGEKATMLILSLAVPITLHGLYDLFVLKGWLGFTLLLMVAMVVITVVAGRIAQARSPFRGAEQDEYGHPRVPAPAWRAMPYGTPVAGLAPSAWPPSHPLYCVHCGSRLVMGASFCSRCGHGVGS